MRKITSGVLALCIAVTQFVNVSAAIGLLKVGTISNKSPLDGAVATTPVENMFETDGKKFILLDSEDGLFVMAEELYGTSPIDRTAGISQNDSVAKFDSDDENNIAYWLNNDFLENGNGEYKLPDSIIENLVDHVWENEPTNLEGYTEEYITECKVALISDYEYRKYITKIGHTPSIEKAASFYLRTACAEGVGSNTCYGLASLFKVPGSTVSPKASVAQYVRPVFYLSPEFFSTVKLENIGENVLAVMDEICDGEKLREIYSNDELDAMFEQPYAQITAIKGNLVEGSQVSAEYSFEYKYEDGNSKIRWYVSDNADSGFEQVYEGNEFYVDSLYVGKYIKASVIPVGKKGANNTGDEAVSEFSIGPVLGSTDMKEVFASIKAAEDMTELLTQYNSLFGLDLKLLTDENKTFVFDIIRKTEISEIVHLQTAYNDAVKLYGIKDSSFDEFDLLVKEILEEEDSEFYASLDEEIRQSIFNKKKEVTSLAVLKTQIKTNMILSVVQMGDGSKILEMFDFADDVVVVPTENKYRRSLIAAGILGEEYASVSALNKAMADFDEEAKAAIYNGEEEMGLTKANRIAQTAPIEGALAQTPARNIFSYDGKEFIVLDYDGDYLFVMAKDYYGTYEFDTTPGIDDNSAQAKYDMNDEHNMAHWINTDFLFKGNGGSKLPSKMIEHMDVMHIWHTEPTNVTGYTTEHMDVGPLALMSYYEWDKYITEYGTDMDGNTGAWLRTARAGAVTNTNSQLYTCFSVPGSTYQQSANRSAYIRPVFYLSIDFFKENKVSNAGDKLASILQTEMTEAQLKEIYSAAEMNVLFKKPMIFDLKINGYPVTGETLTAEYRYDSFYEEKGSVIEWLVSDTANGTYTKVAEGKTFKLTNSHADKYIKIRITPKNTAVINSVGTPVTIITPLGKILSESGLLGEINSAADDKLFEVMSKYGDVITLDLELAELKNKDNVEKMLAAKNFESFNDIYTSYEQAVIIEKINESAQDEISALLNDEKLAIDTERLNNLKDKAEIEKALYDNNYTNIDKFVEDLYEAMALVEFGDVDRTNVKEFLKYYDFIFNEDIAKLSSSVLDSTGKKLIKEDGITTFDKLNKAVSDCVDEAKSGSSSSSGGGGGGGGGSSVSSKGSGGMTFGTAPVMSVVTPVAPGEVNTETNVIESDRTFKDVDEKHWAVQYIETLADKKIVSGGGDGNFYPDNVLTREQFVQMIVNAFSLTSSEDFEISYSDVTEKTWYYKAVKAATEHGIINGTGSGSFGVGEKLSRQDMAVIAARVLEISDLGNAENTGFTDDYMIADYAKHSVKELSSRGIITGYENNSFSPRENTSRAQAAVVIYRLLDAKEGN